MLHSFVTQTLGDSGLARTSSAGVAVKNRKMYSTENERATHSHTQKRYCTFSSVRMAFTEASMPSIFDLRNQQEGEGEEGR